MSIKPFTINVPDSKLQILHQKLSLATFPDELDNAEWDLGVPLDEMKRLVTSWKNDFNWREKERQLNENFAHFTVPVPVSGFGELEIHFIHHRSQVPNAIPLLFVHGWPGSFLEATRLIPLLTKGDENQPAFHLVAPSLPNFGFSQGVNKRGFGLAQYAEAMHGVMKALGYEEYVIQGGDWGSMISRVMARLYPEHTKAIHLNFMPVTPPYPWKNPIVFLQSLLTIPFSSKDKSCLATTMDYVTRGNAYFREQETSPQTLGYALHDSPVGLVAWIYEKLHIWTDNYSWTDDEILTWVSIYQFSTAGPAASVRIYHEAPRKPSPSDVSLSEIMGARAPTTVRFAVAQFSRELIKMPWSWYRSAGTIVREREYEKGGHFAAWEVPQLLAYDVKGFLGKQGEAYGIVSGKDGY